MKNKLMPELYSESNYKNEARHVGFEIEYFGISIDKTARILQNLFGGSIHKQHKNMSLLSDTDLGSFKIELDALPLKNLAEKSLEKQKEQEFDWEGILESVISTTLEGIIPIEINTPPVRVKDIKRLDRIADQLRETEAYDTNESLLTAFGVHINPDIPSEKPQAILSFIQSFILLTDWLKDEMPLDFSRKFSGFVQDYPKAYCQKVLNDTYRPDLSDLIEDYLAYNPSRNRALDMLPLFAHLHGNDIIKKYSVDKLNPRPTFHYRLANSCFSERGWNFTTEWQRWLYVESLAKNDELRQTLAKAYLSSKPSAWLKTIKGCIQ